MKPTRNPLFRAAALSAIVIVATQTLHAANGSWNVDAAGNWSTVGNWNPAAAPGTTAGDVVNLQFNIGAARTVTIDTTSRSVGDLNIGDPTATLFGYTLAASGGAVLNLDGTGSTAATVDYTAAIANAISAPITLVDNGVFRSNVNAVMTLSGVISGASKSLTFNNDTNGTSNAAAASNGQFSVSGNNSYSGGTSISDVRVAVATNASALGSGAVTIASGGQVYCAAALTLANAFSIAGNGWVETATGQPFGALRLESATVSGPVTMTAAAAVGANSGTGTISGIVSGSFALSKRGPATIVLSGANTFNGGVNITNGILQLNNNSAAGSGAIALVTGGSGSTRVAVNGGVTIANNITIPATTGTAGRGNIEYSGTTGAATINGSINVTGAPSGGGHFYGGPSAADVLHLAGPITSTVPLSQRDRFVKYSGGGTGYSSTVTITGTAIVGATNGISTAASLLLGGSAAANLDLNGFNQSLAGISRNANTCVIGNSSTTTDSTLTITGTSTYSGSITDVISTGTRKVGLTVSGGALTLSGTNTHTGATTVTSGSLLVTATSAVPPASALSVASGGKFGYQPNAVGPLTMGGSSNTFAGGSTLGAAIGGIAGESAMNFPAAVAVSGNVTLDIWAVPGASITPGTHTLVSAPLGGLSGATYALGSFFNSSDYTVSNLVVTDTAITIDVTAASPLLAAFWKGGLAAAPSVWTASNGSTQSNWVATSGGANQPLVPGAGTDVVFSNSTVTTAPTAVTLGSNAAANSLTISDTTNGLGIVAVPGNSSTLTIGTGGLSMTTGVPASSIAVPVIVTADQTWTNNSANALSLSSTLNGSTFGLTKQGTGAITVSGASTFGSAVNVNAGSLTLASGTLADSAVTVASGASLTTGAAINGIGSLSTSGTTSISGGHSYSGNTDVLGGTLTMTGGTVAGSALTVASGAALTQSGGTISSGSLSIASGSTFTQTGGVISGSTGLPTAGITTLAGTNTFTGDVDLTGGTLTVALNNGLTGHLGSSPSPATLSKYINFSNGATLRNTNSFNDNTGSATVRQFIFNFGTGGGILDIPATFTMTLDDGAVVSSANNAAQVQGSGNLTKIGDGILSLGNGTSDYSGFTGQIFVNAGTLTTGAVSTNPFGDSASGTTVASGATVDVKGVSVGAEPFTLNGDGVGLVGALISSTIGGTATGPITVASNSSIGGAGSLTLSGAISGSGGLSKVGIGTALLTGNVAGFSGGLTVTAGSLTVPDTMAVGALTLTAGSLAGEITSTSMTLDGGTLFFDPNSVDKLVTGALTVNGAVTLDVTTLPPASTIIPVITSTSLSGAGSFTVANAANYRTAPVVNTSATGVTITFGAGKSLTWTGSSSGIWDINSAQNWNDGVGPDVFFSGDSVAFPEGGANPAITLTGLISPAGLSVNSETTNYTLTSTTGNQLTGATGITKTGASTLTLAGANLHSGSTSIGGGTVAINGSNSIGNSAPGNSIAFSGGGQLRYTGTTAVNFGATRNISVGTGGGVISHNSGTAATLTFPGAISGTGPLTFRTEGASTGTYSLSGTNSAYTGDISISSLGAGLSTVTLANQDAVPTTGSITINHPAGAAVSTNNTLTLAGVSTPVGVTIFTTAGNNTVPVLTRNQITSSGTAAINGPIKVTSVTTGSITQVNPGAGSTITINGNVSEASPGSFIAGSTLFLRGVGNITVNGSINLPTGNVTRTDTGTITFNTTGNNWANTAFAVGTAVLGINDALCTTAPLTLGQNDTNTVTFNMAGFNQTVAGLISNPTAVGANTTGKAITSASAATLTSSPVADVTYAGLITGEVSLIKQGNFTQTLLGSSTTLGDITVNGGTLAANASAGTGTALGAAEGFRTITVNAGGNLSFGAANVLSSNFSSISVPSLVINAGGTVTNNVAGNNALGNVTLNGGTLTATDGHATYGAFNINGDITSTGTSTISASGAAVMMLTSQGDNGVNTASNVAVTSGTLTISAPLGDLSVAESKISSLAKTGAGTLVLSGANSFTGGVTVDAGTLSLTDGAQLRFVIGATSGTNNSLSGSGTVTLEGDFAIDTTAADALTAGSWLLESATSLPGVYGGNFQVVDTAGVPWANTGDTWTKTGAAGRTWTFDEATGTLTLAVSGYDSWATQILNPADRDRTDDPDGDGFTNLQEFLFGTSPNVGNGALVTTQKSGSDLILQWLQRENGASYLLKESTTMGAGSWTTSAIVPVLDDATPVDYDKYKATIPTGGGKKFFRIEGTEN